jgi:hypothetical protein
VGDREALKTIKQALSVDEGFRMSAELMELGLFPSHFKAALEVAVKALETSINEQDDGK